MKAILKYKLPEDHTEFTWATKSSDMYALIWDMDQWLRSQTKYAPDTMSSDTYKAYQTCRDQLHQLMNQHNLTFE